MVYLHRKHGPTLKPGKLVAGESQITVEPEDGKRPQAGIIFCTKSLLPVPSLSENLVSKDISQNMANIHNIQGISSGNAQIFGGKISSSKITKTQFFRNFKRNGMNLAQK